MLYMNKKIVAVLSFVGATTITTSCILSTFAIASDSNKDSIYEPIINPLNRDESFHLFKIGSAFRNNENINNLVESISEGNMLIYVFDENKFTRNFKEIFQSCLSNTTQFKNTWQNYTIECNYDLESTSIKIDVIWYTSIDSARKYYDQFELILNLY